MLGVIAGAKFGSGFWWDIEGLGFRHLQRAAPADYLPYEYRNVRERAPRGKRLGTRTGTCSQSYEYS